MSAAEGSLGSSSSVAAPPPAAPAAPSDSGNAAPSTATPAVEPAAPQSPVAAPSAIPGASTPAPVSAQPTSLAEAHKLFRQQVGLEPGLPAAEIAPPEAPAASEVPSIPETEPVVAAPKEDVVEVKEPEVEEPEPQVAAPPVEEPAQETTGFDEDDDETVLLTAEELDRRYSGRLNKKAKAEIARRETQRGELLQQRNELHQKLGGEVGVELAGHMNQLVWKDYPLQPTAEQMADIDADAEQFVYLLVAPEHGGNKPLAKAVASHLINATISDEVTGPEFANKLINEQWGVRSDGVTKFDFGGMKPLELVDTLMRAVQADIIDLEFLKGELETAPKREPSERELELIRENETLRAGQTAKEAEAKSTQEKAKAAYRTQSIGWVQNQLLNAILPDARKANWAAVDGEEGPVVAEKQALGELVTDHLNLRLLWSPNGTPTKEFQEVLDMIDNWTAFDPTTGKPTPRLLHKMEPFTNKAKAMFIGKQRVLNPRIAFTASKSRNAQLVEKNGSKKTAAPSATAINEPPLVAQSVDTSPVRKTTEELIAEQRKKFDETVRRQQAEAQVGQL